MRSFLLLFQFLILFSSPVFSQQVNYPFVYLNYFRGYPISENEVLLEWETITETAFYGANVYRSEIGVFYPTYFLEFIPGNGISNTPKYYSFTTTVPELGADSTVVYFLELISNAGVKEFCYPVSVNFSTISDVSEQNDKSFNTGIFPNPFNSAATINFSLTRLAHVTLRVFNSLGQEIERLVDDEKNAGNYSINFDATSLSSGIYFYSLQSGNSTLTNKMVLMK